MRMWGVDPSLMCRQHLLGEHVEMHMAVGSLKRGKSVAGFLDGLLDLSQLQARHAELVAEMSRRGMNHKSPLPDVSVPAEHGRIDPVANLVELRRRCEACRGRA